MNEDLSRLLWTVGIGAAIGVPLGLFMRIRQKQACEQYVANCRKLKWWFFAIGGILFTGLAAFHYANSRPLNASFWAVFAVAEYTFAIVRYVVNRKTTCNPRESMPSA